MKLVELLDDSTVELDLKGRSKYEVIAELLDLLVAAGKVKDRDRALQDLIEREEYLSTGLERGLAVPHAKTPAVEELVLAFGLSREGVDFESNDGKPAHFIFLLLSPVNTSGPHIKALAQITRNFSDPKIGSRLLEARSKQEVLDILSTFQ